ncbi:Hypp4930 [Branchiostoma lanceolatum]|uniref:Hypp4930 protein n=1 Tax=Branchiostoma lanceolatum TaxID=7740 RepID=A0A8K0AD72_BRALA|nr:Hypp4930 [Branchiostoma lanceolatum]
MVTLALPEFDSWRVRPHLPGFRLRDRRGQMGYRERIATGPGYNVNANPLPHTKLTPLVFHTQIEHCNMANDHIFQGSVCATDVDKWDIENE